MKSAEDLLLIIGDVLNIENEIFQQGEWMEVENLRICGEPKRKLLDAEVVATDITRKSDVDKGKFYELESHIESLELSVDQPKTHEASPNVM